MKNYVDMHKEKIQKTPGGTLCQVFGDKENAACSVALVMMEENSNGVMHYHDNITEIYLFSKGIGKIIINGNENIIKEGDCYIIPPNNIHYIKAETSMNFACICTPPWTEHHEFITDTYNVGKNLPKIIDNGIIEILGPEKEHNIKLYETNSTFIPNNEMLKYNRVYYFISGTGKIIINDKEYYVEANHCYEINNKTPEQIIPDSKLKYVLICGLIK